MKQQPYTFGLADSLLAEVGDVPLDVLHRDVDAICRCYDRIQPLTDRLGVEAPRPRLAGFSYCHVSALGAEVVFPEGSEPNVVFLVHRPEDIDQLREPEEYLKAGVVPRRVQTLHELLSRRPDAARGIGHQYEGPVTTAALLMGPSFFTLPYDDPKRAHRLLSFCVESALNYVRVLRAYFGERDGPGPVGIPDDFAGMFPPSVFAEFVVPYWEQMYQGLGATERHLHSELLRKDHLPFLAELNIAVFDPSADQYVSTELLHEHCPVPFTARIQSWHIRDHTPEALQAMYRRLATHDPVRISFYMTSLDEEEKIAALLQVARELAQEGEDSAAE